MSKPRRNRRESGFAILLVFVLAAVMAITLYYELPRSMFERTREREQLLIDRGEQYSLAIRRFYVKFGRFPAKMDDLENTNNMRFLRRQYKDPMTGEADWRIIHETAGVLTDSVVHPAPQTQSRNGTGGSQSFGTLNSSQPFGSSPSSSTDATSEQAAPKAWGLLARPSDRGPLGNAHGGVSVSDDTQQPASADNGPLPAPAPPDAGATGDTTNQNTTAATPPVPQDPNATGPGGAQPGAAPGDVAKGIQDSLTHPRQLPGTISGQSQSMTGGGIGIAGVASKSEFRGIKRYNDRSKYKEWEFVFDLSKLQQQQQQGQQQTPGTQPGQQPPPPFSSK
jgi:hypothetical protein